MPRPTVRVLRGDAELAAAAERAAEGQRRLQVRLEARAVKDAWTAQNKEFGRRDLEGHRPEHAPSPHSPAA